MIEGKIKSNDSSSTKQINLSKLPAGLERVNLHAAGIDIGGGFHCVAIPEGRDSSAVREFESFTSDLKDLVSWLKKNGIETVAMESTGVYWIPLYEMLEASGIDVLLVNARQIKNVSGRKTDVLDCQWIQRLHTYGLLQGAFRPDAKICELRGYLRQRGMLIKSAAIHIQHMQKALILMNLQLTNVLSDISGETGMKIIRCIISGERNPAVLAQHRDPRCKSTKAKIEKSLTGHYKEEQVFALKQAVELYDFYQARIEDCDRKIEEHLLSFVPKIKAEDRQENTEENTKKKASKRGNGPSFKVKELLHKVTGVDLTRIPGVDGTTALNLIAEIGFDLSRFRSAKAFASWLGLSPENKISGGKILGSKTKRTSSRAARSLRMAAFTLSRSKSALGAFYRRLKGRLGPAKAITATAHKLALIIYSMLKNGEAYVEKGQEYYETAYRERALKSLKKRAHELGFALVENGVNSGLAG